MWHVVVFMCLSAKQAGFPFIIFHILGFKNAPEVAARCPWPSLLGALPHETVGLLAWGRAPEKEKPLARCKSNLAQLPEEESYDFYTDHQFALLSVLLQHYHSDTSCPCALIIIWEWQNWVEQNRSNLTGMQSGDVVAKHCWIIPINISLSCL